MASLLWAVWPGILGAGMTAVLVYLSLMGVARRGGHSPSIEAEVNTLHSGSHDHPIAG
jgi:hypothetical protein